MDDEVFVSTDLVAVADQSAFWRELARPLYEVLIPPEDRARPFEGSVRSRRLGSLLVAANAFSRHQFRRDRRVIVQGELDSYLIQTVTSGTMSGDFNGVDVSVEPGDICIVDLAQTFSSSVECGSRIMVSIPRSYLERGTGARNLHGTVLKADWPVTRLISAYLTGLRSLGANLSLMQSEAVLEALATLLAGALNGEAADDEPSACAPLEAALRQRTLDFIAQNIHLQDLSPEFLARRFNVSRSHLYRAFARDGGVATVLREKRLDMAFLQLTRPGARPRSIADIAYGLGFSSSNQLLRAFRARFGLTPSEARNERSLSGDSVEFQPDLQAHFADLHSRTLK